MNTRRSPHLLTVAALAASLMLAACGGGSGEPPPEQAKAAADTTGPVITITDSVVDATATGDVTFTFVFNEDVGTSFTADDVTVVSGGSKGSFTRVSGTRATLVVTPTPNSTGTVVISVAANAALDARGNGNALTTSQQAFNTVVPPPVTGTVVLANFDTVTPPVAGFEGAEGSAIETGPAGGGSGRSFKLLRSGGQNFALGIIETAVPITATRRTVSAQVYSPTAGIPMILKLEGPGGANTGDVAANETVVVGWQTLTWTFTTADPSRTYNKIVLLPNLGTVDAPPGKAYYFDSINLQEAAAPPPPTGGTVLASFDEATPLAVSIFGGTVATLEAGPAGGGSGQALKMVRNGGEPWAGAWVAVPTIPSATSPRTITARVYSPTAGVPMVAKIEYADNAGSGDTQASAPIVAGWQTVSWTFNNLDATKVYNRFVIIPNLGTVDTAKTYYIDDVKLLDAAAPPPPPPTGGTVLASFDETTPLAVSIFGGTVATLEAGPAGGGSAQALKLVRNGGEPWAGAWVAVPTIPSATSPRTITAKVFSPTASIPVVAKLEFGDNTGTGDTQASAPIVAGWQTVSWTFNNLDATKVYNRFVIIPNLGTVDTAKTYFIDDITLADATGGGTSTPGAEMGAGGPQTLTIATGDVKTGDGGNTMFVAGEGLFAVNVVGSAEAFAPFNLAAWPNAKTASFAGITGISGGDIGYFQDDVNLSNSSQKVDEGGWVAGTALAPLGVPNFFRYFVLKGPVSNDAYMGLYMNAPNNGTVNVSSFSKIKIKVWGPGPMFERTNFNPVLQVTLTGPKVAGCTTGSGGSEITQNLTANLKNGAGGFYTLPLSGFTVKGLCGTDSGAANVLAKLARVVVTVPGTSFNYTNLDGGNYATGVNLGPVGFTNN